MRFDAPVRDRVLDSLERKKKVARHNFADNPDGLKAVLEEIDSQIKKILARTPKGLSKKEGI